jgi:hypothetical protein
MQKLKEYKYIILLSVIIIAFVFYWYSYKPYKIRKKCGSEILWDNNFNDLYGKCLRSEGLEK